MRKRGLEGLTRRRWHRVHSFYTEITRAGARCTRELSDEKSADLSSEGSAFLIIRPETLNPKGGEKMRRLKRKGQSVLEYVLVLTAIITAILIALPHIRERVTGSLQDATSKMETAVNDRFQFR